MNNIKILMGSFLIFLMTIQAYLFYLGIVELNNGKTEIGLFLVIINSIFFMVNISNFNKLINK